MNAKPSIFFIRKEARSDQKESSQSPSLPNVQLPSQKQHYINFKQMAAEQNNPSRYISKFTFDDTEDSDIDMDETQESQKQ